MFNWVKLRIKADTESKADEVIGNLTKCSGIRNIQYQDGYVTYEQYGWVQNEK